MLEMFAIKIYNPYKLSIKCIPHNTTVTDEHCLLTFYRLLIPMSLLTHLQFDNI